MECRMPYSRYKQHYSDCDTLGGSYREDSKSIVVLVPDGRMKPSGVRGERFKTIFLDVGSDPMHTFRQGFRAVCLQNAIKQAKAAYKYVEES
ncbi:MAG: hypothetical protein AAGU23_02650 [Bacillota bacterium]